MSDHLYWSTTQLHGTQLPFLRWRKTDTGPLFKKRLFIVILVKLIFFYLKKLINLIFIIFILLVVGFKTWTCWLYSWNDLVLVGTYVLNMSSTWQQIIMLYLNFSARFKSVMQHYVCYYAPSIENCVSAVFFLIFGTGNRFKHGKNQ